MGNVGFRLSLLADDLLCGVAFLGHKLSPSVAVQNQNYIENPNIRPGPVFGGARQFDTLDEAKVLVERWRHVYNRIRPHSSLGYRPPAPETKKPWPPGFAPPFVHGSRDLVGSDTTIEGRSEEY